MPALSRKQQQLMAIAEHSPGKLYKKNRGVLKMNKSQLHDYSSTKGLGNALVQSEMKRGKSARRY